jgi:hypothetical protein
VTPRRATGALLGVLVLLLLPGVRRRLLRLSDTQVHRVVHDGAHDGAHDGVHDGAHGRAPR